MTVSIPLNALISGLWKDSRQVGSPLATALNCPQRAEVAVAVHDAYSYVQQILAVSDKTVPGRYELDAMRLSGRIYGFTFGFYIILIIGDDSNLTWLITHVIPYQTET